MFLCINFHSVAEGNPNIDCGVDCHKIYQSAPKGGVKGVHQVGFCKSGKEGFDGCPARLLATDELRKWIDYTNANLQMQFLHTPREIQRVHQWISAVTRGIQADYPFYATKLPCVANILFQQNEMGAIFLNPAAFGELVVMVRHIEAEPVVVQFWSEIHPRIVNVSHELYVDGHYSSIPRFAVDVQSWTPL